MATSLTPVIIKEKLGMKSHPAGGWYAENFKDNHSSAIYFLLEARRNSVWHRVKDAVVVWHWYGGSAVELKMCDGSTSRSLLLGEDLMNAQRPQAVVPAGWWQTAKCLGDWTFAGCTVSPGFDFAQFEMAAPELIQQLEMQCSISFATDSFN